MSAPKRIRRTPEEARALIIDAAEACMAKAGPAGLRFTGSALLPATALNLGTNFATISNISVTPVPEPSALGLSLLGLACILRRRRR